MARNLAGRAKAAVRTRAGWVVGSAFESPALLLMFLLVGLLIFWAVEGNVYGLVSTLVAIVLAAVVTVRSARRR